MAASQLPTAPSTPKSASLPSQPGTWKHPQFDEISRRQNASTFSDRNVQKLLYNVGGLVFIWLFQRIVNSSFPSFWHAVAIFHPYAAYAVNTIRIIFAYNVLKAVLPLIRPKDELGDIPLTPAQRKLLGLNESGGPPTPGSTYITPPRYARTPNSTTASPNSAFSKSPLSGRNSIGPDVPQRDSPFSPNASPLLQKAIGGMANARRSSYGSPSPLGGSMYRTLAEGPSTPSPKAGKGAGVGLNNRWLYERGRGSPGAPSLYT